MTQCPCGLDRGLDDCCGPIIAGAPAPTAESLMRSRYTAYTLDKFDYLLETLAPEVRGEFDTDEAAESFKNTVWEGLEIRSTVAGGAEDQVGQVEFMARFRVGKERRIHRENATFRREAGRWVCDGGEMDPKGPPRKVTKVGRNEPCPCGSGKKYKKCCGA